MLNLVGIRYQSPKEKSPNKLKIRLAPIEAN